MKFFERIGKAIDNAVSAIVNPVKKGVEAVKSFDFDRVNPVKIISNLFKPEVKPEAGTAKFPPVKPPPVTPPIEKPIIYEPVTKPKFHSKYTYLMSFVNLNIVTNVTELKHIHLVSNTPKTVKELKTMLREEVLENEENMDKYEEWIPLIDTIKLVKAWEG